MPMYFLQNVFFLSERVGRLSTDSSSPLSICIRPQNGVLYPVSGTRLEFTDACAGEDSLFVMLLNGAIVSLISSPEREP